MKQIACKRHRSKKNSSGCSKRIKEEGWRRGEAGRETRAGSGLDPWKEFDFTLEEIEATGSFLLG